MMKRTIKYFLFATALLLSAAASAQDCDLRLSVAPIDQGTSVPYAINSKIETHLIRAISAMGVTADPYYGQFFVSGRFDHGLDDVVPGPPRVMCSRRH